VVHHSSVVENEAGMGGGINSGVVDVRNSSVSRNRAITAAQVSFGGAMYVGGGAGDSTIVNSTLSGNVGIEIAAAFFQGGVAIFNSTITANQGDGGAECFGGAVQSRTSMELESTILAGNACDADVGDGDQFGDNLVSGSHNLIGTSAVPVPDDTISADPRLAPLAYNGGSTLSHRPLGDSPAIGRGNNPLELGFDQRGAGFPRVRMGQPDIGAIER
jgi:hypothetical protein